MDDAEENVRHLEFILRAVERMSQNAFLLKGWTVVLVAALFALAADAANERYVIIAFLPAVTFWLLDAYYLRQERLFRALYERVVAGDGSIPRFSMSTKPVRANVDSWFSTLFAPTVAVFHAPIIGVVGAALLYAARAN